MGYKHTEARMLHELHTAAYYCVWLSSNVKGHVHNSLQGASGVSSITLSGYS